MSQEQRLFPVRFEIPTVKVEDEIIIDKGFLKKISKILRKYNGVETIVEIDGFIIVTFRINREASAFWNLIRKPITA